jgi:cysteine protease ATG4
MLLAETFLRLYLDRDFEWQSGVTGNAFYWKILSYFRDEKLAAYSIQQIASMGVSEGIPIGKWFGPNAIAQVLNKLNTYEDSNHLRFYIAMDNCIFIDEIYEAMTKCNKCIKCKQHPKGVCNKWSPLLLIIPLRLGLNEFNQDYKESIKNCFHLKQSVGMIGGKPNQAYYFYGYADESLLYMDPHEVQPYIPNFVEDMNDSTYHTNTMWKLKFSQLDPSIALAFVCKLEEDFLDLLDALRANVIKKDDMNSLFEISDKRPVFEDGSGCESLDALDDDEFVLI